MKLVLDTEKTRGDTAVLLYLFSLLSGYRITVDTFEEARKRGLLRFSQMYDPRKPFPEYVTLNETGEHVIESSMAECSVPENSVDRFESLASKMMECFPAGYKKGSDSSTKLPWRGNVKTIADRLRKFVMKYGDFSDDEFVDAAKRYVADNAGSPYMRVLLYFIYKNVDGEKQIINGKLVGDKDKISPLADYLSNKEEKPVNVDWDITLC